MKLAICEGQLKLSCNTTSKPPDSSKTANLPLVLDFPMYKFVGLKILSPFAKIFFVLKNCRYIEKKHILNLKN